MSFYTHEFSSLIDVSPVASASVAVLDPLSAQVSLALTTALEPRLSDLDAKLLSAIAGHLQVSVPSASLAGVVKAQAELTALLPPPMPSFFASVQVYLDLISSLELSIAAIKVMISALLSLNASAIDLSGQISGLLAAGPVRVVSWEPPGTESASVAGQLAAALDSFSGPTYGIMLVTQAPEAWAGIKFMLKANG